MRGLFVGLFTVAVVVGGGLLFLNKKNISLPKIAVSQPQKDAVSGQVKGAQDQLVNLGENVSKVANRFGLATVKTGATLVNNVTTTPSSQKDVIDMATVVKEVTSRVENIPSNLLQDAKVEYCRQVLEAATVSGVKK